MKNAFFLALGFALGWCARQASIALAFLTIHRKLRSDYGTRPKGLP